MKARSLRADNRARTGDLNLGKVALYQLSYVRGTPAPKDPLCVRADINRSEGSESNRPHGGGR